MPTTTNGLRYPGDVAPNFPQHFQNLASDVDAALLNPITLRTVGRQVNNVLSGATQAYGSSSAGSVVAPAGSASRLVDIHAHIDIHCPSSTATAGSLRLWANGTELLPSAGTWGTFHNLVATGTYAAGQRSMHVHWSGRLPASEQNIWLQVQSDPGTAAFWVTMQDLTVVYR